LGRGTSGKNYDPLSRMGKKKGGSANKGTTGRKRDGATNGSKLVAIHGDASKILERAMVDTQSEG